MDEAYVHLRVPKELKAKWVRQSRAEGMRLSDWIVERIEQKVCAGAREVEDGTPRA